MFSLSFPKLVSLSLFSNILYLNLSGPINIPIECTSKKAVVSVEESVIDFKKVPITFEEFLKIKFIGYLWRIIQEIHQIYQHWSFGN